MLSGHSSFYYIWMDGRVHFMDILCFWIIITTPMYMAFVLFCLDMSSCIFMQYPEINAVFTALKLNDTE